MLTRVAELHWEHQDQLTVEGINALIEETILQLQDEGFNDFVFSRWDSFIAPKSMETWDVIRLWITVRVQKEIEKERKARSR